MGSGKSQGAIHYMNTHSSEKFVYATPYLSETKRIKEGCPELNFIEPSDKIYQFRFSKSAHCESLISAGENVAITHQLFRLFGEDTITEIKRHNYTLIIDEVIDVFVKVNHSLGDIQLLVDAGYIKKVNGMYETGDIEYTGTRLKDLFDMLKHNRLIEIENGKGGTCFYYWVFPKEILEAFSNVFILTYLFESQDMKYYFDIHRIEYEKIGVTHNGDNNYSFSQDSTPPEYIKSIKDKIHIFDNEKLNSIGDNKHDLSDSWYNRAGTTGVTNLKNNLYNYFRYYHSDIEATDKMWGTFNKRKGKLRGKGYSSGYVVFNKRATNEFSNKKVLAYCSNIFAPPEKKNYFSSFGIDYDEDSYALSILIQWIWRSAIRKGETINIYIPSKRMRELLKKWISSLDKLVSKKDTG